MTGQRILFCEGKCKGCPEEHNGDSNLPSQEAFSAKVAYPYYMQRHMQKGKCAYPSLHDSHFWCPSEMKYHKMKKKYFQ